MSDISSAIFYLAGHSLPLSHSPFPLLKHLRPAGHGKACLALDGRHSDCEHDDVHWQGNARGHPESLKAEGAGSKSRASHLDRLSSPVEMVRRSPRLPRLTSEVWKEIFAGGRELCARASSSPSRYCRRQRGQVLQLR